MARSYPPEFRRKVLDRLDAGHSVTAIAHDLGITGQTIYNWRNQHLIDTGRREGITSSDHVELVAARKRIASLEADLAASHRAVELLKAVVPPKARVGAVAAMVSEDHSVQSSCRVLDVAESTFYADRARVPSNRQIRHAWLTDLIIHVADHRILPGLDH